MKNQEVITQSQRQESMTTSEIKRYTICPECRNEVYGLTYWGVCGKCSELLKDKVKILLPDKYKNMSFSNYKVKTQANADALSKAKSFMTSPKGLFLSGSVGTGKTHLATACFCELKRSGKSAMFVSVPDLLLEIRESFDHTSPDTEREIIEKYTNYDYLFLDDFGSEKISDFTIETIYLLIDKRYRENRNKVFITSNLSLQGIAEKMSDRISSRIAEMCEGLNLKLTHDWRTNSFSFVEKSIPNEVIEF